jgi:hypothetical protein
VRVLEPNALALEAGMFAQEGFVAPGQVDRFNAIVKVFWLAGPFNHKSPARVAERRPRSVCRCTPWCSIPFCQSTRGGLHRRPSTDRKEKAKQPSHRGLLFGESSLFLFCHHFLAIVKADTTRLFAKVQTGTNVAAR